MGHRRPLTHTHTHTTGTLVPMSYPWGGAMVKQRGSQEYYINIIVIGEVRVSEPQPGPLATKYG